MSFDRNQCILNWCENDTKPLPTDCLKIEIIADVYLHKHCMTIDLLFCFPKILIILVFSIQIDIEFLTKLDPIV